MSTEQAIVVDDTPEVEAPEEVAPIEAVTEEPTETLTKPKVEFSPDQQEFIDSNIVAPKVGKQREAERTATEATRRADGLQAELDKINQPQRPVVPDAPDQYDDDFDAKQALRETKIQELAVFENTERQQAAYAQNQSEEAARKSDEKFQEVVVAYSDRAEKIGIKPQELQQAGIAVASMGMDVSVVQHILTEDQGPAITVYLAANPVEADALARMHPMQAAVHIATEIKPKALAARPKIEIPPEPTETPVGGGFAGSGWVEGSGFE